MPTLNTPLHHSGFTAVAAFLLTREVWNSRAGLLAACFIAIVPGYISRSVAGSYDNEGIAIFALLFTYFLWLKSVKTSSVFWSTCASLSYFYMVSGGWCVCGGEGRSAERHVEQETIKMKRALHPNS